MLSEDAIIVLSSDGSIVHWTSGAEKLFGYRREEAVGNSINILVPQNRLDEHREIMDKISQGEAVKQLETIRLHKSGRWTDVRVTVVPSERDGRPGAIMTAQDISAIKKMQQQHDPTVAPEPAAPSMPRGDETILLVDDEASVRLVAASALQACGYTVLAAESGDEAVTIAGSHAGIIHLIVSDVVMPFMGGPQLAAYLCALNPQLRVLFLSGFPLDADSFVGVVRPAAFLQKPFTPRDLAQKVREVLDKPD
jgi:PAS domain S-box-containing protein